VGILPAASMPEVGLLLPMAHRDSEIQGSAPATPPTRMRADALLVARGLAASRDRARTLIQSGAVQLDGAPLAKASRLLEPDAPLELTRPDIPWVSRGALKLLGGLDAFTEIDPAGQVCLDIGASTGGFTEVLLAHGAARIFAVDVGHNQLHPRLRDEARVVVMEGTNARDLESGMFDVAPGLIVCDASFISLAKVLPAALALAAPGAWLLALVKPQFEVGPRLVGKGGVVRDAALHAEVTATAARWLQMDMGWKHLGTVPSPIDGPDGNREFLMAGQKP